jgi:hypothetical protein
MQELFEIERLRMAAVVLVVVVVVVVEKKKKKEKGVGRWDVLNVRTAFDLKRKERLQG